MLKNKPYLEVIKTPAKAPATLVIRLTKHLQSRQYLGSAVVVCSDTHAMLSAVRKQWVKATRHLQSLRASTLNPEDILRLTHHVIHMQHMKFIARPPQEKAGAAVYFITPQQVEALPIQCASVYATEPCDDHLLATMAESLPANATVVSYVTTEAFAGLRPKRDIEAQVTSQWHEMLSFLTHLNIQVNQLQLGSATIEEALDSLLTRSSEFLHLAAALQHYLGLAQPLHGFTGHEQRQFEVIIRLAHRVQALSPGSFNSYLLRVFGENEATNYFLRDGNFED